MEVVIDPSVFEDMPPALKAKLIKLWMKDTTSTLSELKVAVEKKDEEAVMTRLHTLKGVSAQVGAVTLSEMAATMESQGPTVSQSRKLSLLDIVFADSAAKMEQLLVE